MLTPLACARRAGAALPAPGRGCKGECGHARLTVRRLSAHRITSGLAFGAGPGPACRAASRLSPNLALLSRPRHAVGRIMSRSRGSPFDRGIRAIVSLSFPRSAVFGALLCCFSAVLLPGLASAGEPRSYAAKREFQREHPCPSTGRTSGACPGYVKDHIKPLACRGPDTAANPQWQTTQAARAKDKWERKSCAR
jgi:hypothetical protein